MDNEKTIISRSDFMHFQIAVRYFLNFKKVRDSYTSSDEIKSIKDIDWETISESDHRVPKLEELSSKIMRLIFEIRTFGIITLTNSVMCLEGLINLYGAHKSSNSYFKNHLDKLDLKSKWILIPKLFSGHGIDKGSRMFGHFSSLVEARNKMIHPKSKVLELNPSNNFPVPSAFIEMMTQLDSQFQSMLLMIIELKKMDSNFEPIEVYKFLWDKNSKMHGFAEFESFKASMFTESKTHNS